MIHLTKCSETAHYNSTRESLKKCIFSLLSYTTEKKHNIFTFERLEQANLWPKLDKWLKPLLSHQWTNGNIEGIIKILAALKKRRGRVSTYRPLPFTTSLFSVWQGVISLSRRCKTHKRNSTSDTRLSRKSAYGRCTSVIICLICNLSPHSNLILHHCMQPDERAGQRKCAPRKRQIEKLAFRKKKKKLWPDFIFQLIWWLLPGEAARKLQLPRDLHSPACRQAPPAPDKSYRARLIGCSLPGEASSIRGGLSLLMNLASFAHIQSCM